VADSDLLAMGAAPFSALMTRQPAISWAVLSVLNDRIQEADTARMVIAQEEQDLARRVANLKGEAERLAELARVRQETIELLVHDLRTPVAVIDGCLQLLEASLSPEALESVAKVMALAERSTARLMALLEELLGAARQESGLSTLAREPFDLGDMLREAIESAQATARGAELTLSLALPEPAASGQPGAGLTAMGDRTQVRRVVDNLVQNAISYTPGGGKIVVAAAPAGDEIEVSVTDTGPGVPAEHREIIFERFTRVPGIEGRRQGFGLGLYFCRQVIEAHGGRIWVEPGPGGVGSRFVFTLPRQ
jgi:signal transduction histidine kinase